jgi:hypothetical protein
MYLRIRNLCGFLGISLPWLALFSSGIAEHPGNDWWWSISATYYQSPALVGVLVPAALVLISYIGYDNTDNFLTSLAGIFGLGIVLFPCKVSWIPDGTPVGFFQMPVELSHMVHVGSAGIFFLSIALNSIFQFTKSGPVMTDRKRIRNRIYRICGYSMIVVEIVFFITYVSKAPGYIAMILEIILLHLFGFAWLVKGGAFPFLNDKEEEDGSSANDGDASDDSSSPVTASGGSIR